MLIGFLITVVGTFPPIFFDRYITLGTLLERYLVPAMLGILMLIGGFIFSIEKQLRFQILPGLRVDRTKHNDPYRQCPGLGENVRNTT